MLWGSAAGEAPPGLPQQPLSPRQQPLSPRRGGGGCSIEPAVRDAVVASLETLPSPRRGETGTPLVPAMTLDLGEVALRAAEEREQAAAEMRRRSAEASLAASHAAEHEEQVSASRNDVFGIPARSVVVVPPVETPTPSTPVSAGGSEAARRQTYVEIERMQGDIRELKASQRSESEAQAGGARRATHEQMARMEGEIRELKARLAVVDQVDGGGGGALPVKATVTAAASALQEPPHPSEARPGPPPHGGSAVEAERATEREDKLQLLLSDVYDKICVCSKRVRDKRKAEDGAAALLVQAGSSLAVGSDGHHGSEDSASNAAGSGGSTPSSPSHADGKEQAETWQEIEWLRQALVGMHQHLQAAQERTRVLEKQCFEYELQVQRVTENGGAVTMANPQGAPTSTAAQLNPSTFRVASAPTVQNVGVAATTITMAPTVETTAAASASTMVANPTLGTAVEVRREPFQWRLGAEVSTVSVPLETGAYPTMRHASLVQAAAEAGTVTDDLFNVVDTNRDGQISRSEFKSAIREGVLSAECAAEWRTASCDELPRLATEVRRLKAAGGAVSPLVMRGAPSTHRAAVAVYPPSRDATPMGCRQISPRADLGGALPPSAQGRQFATGGTATPRQGQMEVQPHGGGQRRYVAPPKATSSSPRPAERITGGVVGFSSPGAPGPKLVAQRQANGFGTPAPSQKIVSVGGSSIATTPGQPFQGSLQLQSYASTTPGAPPPMASGPAQSCGSHSSATPGPSPGGAPARYASSYGSDSAVAQSSGSSSPRPHQRSCSPGGIQWKVGGLGSSSKGLLPQRLHAGSSFGSGRTESLSPRPPQSLASTGSLSSGPWPRAAGSLPVGAAKVAWPQTLHR